MALTRIKDIVTPEDKRLFLQFIRQGWDRSSAARKVNSAYTGTMFKYLCSSQSRSYDHEFAVAYDQAVAERGPVHRARRGQVRAPRPTMSSGRQRAMSVPDARLDHFIALIKEGDVPFAALQKINDPDAYPDEPPTSLNQIDWRAKNDQAFAQRFREAREVGYPIMQERLRAEAMRQAYNGDYRALRDMLLIHLPEYDKLLTQRHQVEQRVDMKSLIVEQFGSLPPAVLDEMIRLAEEAEPKQLPSGGTE